VHTEHLGAASLAEHALIAGFARTRIALRQRLRAAARSLAA
jgi:hypothetical protein